jgi:hypothetical protein
MRVNGGRPAKCQHLYPTLLPWEHACTAAQCTQPQKYVCKYIKMDVCEHKRNNKKYSANLPAI